MAVDNFNCDYKQDNQIIYKEMKLYNHNLCHIYVTISFPLQIAHQMAFAIISSLAIDRDAGHLFTCCITSSMVISL